MLKIDVLSLGDYQTNCYIIRETASKTCCVIDPGYEPERILRYLDQLGLTVEAILLTHGHFDHVGGVAALAAETDCEVYICPEDLKLPPMMTNGRLFYTKTYAQGDTLHLSGLDIEVIQTPGHTPGSVCLLVEEAMFAGDTLFAGSCGRTDLPGGNMSDMRKSLSRLKLLNVNYAVYPGHGGFSTLEEEKRFNPYM